VGAVISKAFLPLGARLSSQAPSADKLAIRRRGGHIYGLSTQCVLVDARAGVGVLMVLGGSKQQDTEGRERPEVEVRS
jgi:hypothetical protein